MRVILTGVGKGFGRSLLDLYAANPDTEILGVTRSLSDFSAQEISDYQSKNVRLTSADLSSKEDLNQFILDNSSSFQNVNVLINNAGQRFRKKLEDIDYSELEELFRINVITPMILTQAALPGMKSRNFGRIINISSILGKSGLPDLSGYAGTKGAIDSITRALSVEVAEHGITVNAIAPGFCETSYAAGFQKKSDLNDKIVDRIPMKKWGAQTEINGLCKFLTGPEAQYLTGQVIYIDGGWTAA